MSVLQSISIEGTVDAPTVEDSGCAKYSRIDETAVHVKALDSDPNDIYFIDDEGFFVELHSWSNHTIFNTLVGKKIRITIEVLD